MATYTSQNALARAVGVSKSTMSGYVERSDWPVHRKAPWTDADLVLIQSWRGMLQEDRSGKSEASSHVVTPDEREKYNQVRTLKIYHEQRKKKVEADLAEGRAIPKSTHERSMASLATIFVQTMDELFERLPHELPGDPDETERICKSQWRDVRQMLSDQVALELDKVDDEIIARLDNRRHSHGRAGGA